MSDKISSAISYGWNASMAWIVGVFSFLGGITPEWWVPIISAIGTIVTLWMNWHWKKRNFELALKKKKIERGESDQ